MASGKFSILMMNQYTSEDPEDRIMFYSAKE